MAAPLSTAAVVNAIIFATYSSCTRAWEDLLEDRQGQDGVHETLNAEGGVFLDHDRQAKECERREGGVDVGESSSLHQLHTDSDESSILPRRRRQE